MLWACCNAIDQHLGRVHRTHQSIAALAMVFSCMLPFAFVAYSLAAPITFNSSTIFWIGIGTALNLIALIPYYRALALDEAYNVVPYMEITPVLLTLLAVVINNEVLTSHQALGIALTIGCGFLFSWDFHKGRFHFRTLAIVAAASVFFAGYQFCLKQAAVIDDTWTVAFYYAVGQSFCGFLSLILFAPLRREVISTASRTRGVSIALAVLTNMFSFLALASLVRAFALAPSTGHVAGLSGAQPIFSLLIGQLLGKFLPRFFTKLSFGHELGYKLLLIGGIAYGVYLIAKV